jgi:hypothetical protein
MRCKSKIHEDTGELVSLGLIIFASFGFTYFHETERYVINSGRTVVSQHPSIPLKRRTVHLLANIHGEELLDARTRPHFNLVVMASCFLNKPKARKQPGGLSTLRC